MPAISVILPVYNVEPYIGTCIESLKQQSFGDLEFIFVDDCSTENSVAVIEDFREPIHVFGSSAIQRTLAPVQPETEALKPQKERIFHSSTRMTGSHRIFMNACMQRQLQ